MAHLPCIGWSWSPTNRHLLGVVSHLLLTTVYMYLGFVEGYFFKVCTMMQSWLNHHLGPSILSKSKLYSYTDIIYDIIIICYSYTDIHFFSTGARTKPLFAAVTGRGPCPTYLYYVYLRYAVEKHLFKAILIIESTYVIRIILLHLIT